MKSEDIRRVILEELSVQAHTRMSLWVAVKEKLPDGWRWETFKRWHSKMNAEKLLGSTMAGGVTITEEGKDWLKRV
jgi:hypothetical protein